MQKTALTHRSRVAALSPERLMAERWLDGSSIGFPSQTWRIMRMITFFLLVASFAFAERPAAQTVTLSGKDLSLEEVFTVIEKQTGFLVVYNLNLLDRARPVSLSVTHMPVSDFMQVVVKDQSLNFMIFNKTITLSRKPAPVPLPLAEDIMVPATNISGRLITYGAAEPIAAASVSIKGGKSGTISNSAGYFTLSNLPDNTTLTISSIGFQSLEVPLSKLMALSSGASLAIKGATVKKLASGEFLFILPVSDKLLDEAVTTAYGRTSRRLTTGNISTVKADEIARQPVMTALEAVIGRVPGITIGQISGNAATPISVSIRGLNSINSRAMTDPLYVIDGIPMSTLNASTLTGSANYSMGAIQGGLTNTGGENQLLSINPRDIESISILKDADATAIYGSRGANGVILITTKRAKPGPTSLELNVNSGAMVIQKYPELLNTQEYLAVRREAFRNDGIAPTRENALDLLVWDTTKYTDWQRAFLGTGSVTTVDAKVGGGTVQSNYSLSAAYTSRKELMNNGGKNARGTLRSDFNHASNNQKFKLSFSNNLSLTDVKAYAIGDLSDLAPNAPDVYNSRGELNFEPYRRQFNNQEFRFGTLKRPSESETFSVQSNVNLRYELLKGLSISVLGGYMFMQNENALYWPQASSDPMFFPMSLAYFGKSTGKNWQVEPQLKYQTYLGRGNLSAQLISNFQNAVTRGETIMASSFPNDAMMKSYNNAASKTFTEGLKEYKYLSVSGIINYSWDHKYVINLNVRRDGSSRMGPGKQFGDFGSIGLRWNASDEEWMKKILPDWVNFISFRGSYGITGSDNIGDYEYLSRWSRSSRMGNSPALFKYNGTEVFHVVRPLNQEFQWESARKRELSTSLAFWQDRINVDISYYSHLSKDQLTSIPLPQLTGFREAVTNWPAEIRNSGVEVSASVDVINAKDWGLSVNANVGRNRNKLISFPDLENSSYKGNLKVGYSTTTDFKLRYTGIDPLTGSYTFEDYNKDGRITTGTTRFPMNDQDDRYIPVDYIPKYSGGFGLNLNYKTLSMFSQFMFVNKLRNNPYFIVPGTMNKNISLPDEVKNSHWQHPGDLVKYPRYTTNAAGLGPFRDSDAFYSNGSYIRLTTLAISWQLPQTWLSKIKIKHARLSMQAQNLLTLSPYKGLDPEVPTAAVTTPIPRTITTNLSFTF